MISSQAAQKIAIIGAGFSGTALAANLHRLSMQPLDILLFEKREQFGLGDAYSTPHAFHWLNVRAEDMSAFAQEPLHFVNWLRTQSAFPMHDAPSLPDEYVPRLWYGRYLQSLIQAMQTETSAQWSLQTIKEEVIDILPVNHQLKIIGKDGHQFLVDKVVLALGNPPPSRLPHALPASVQCIQDPWDFSALKRIEPQEDVLIVGTGLSMIDTILTLNHQQHHGKMYALSRRGLLPLSHVLNKLPAYTLSAALPHSLRALTKYVRALSQACERTGEDWRALMNALRTRVPQWWAQASVRDKQQFIRHVLPYWNIHRHRVHPDVTAMLQGLRTQSRLELLAGRIVQVDEQGVSVQLRREADLRTLPVKWIINCMGPSLSLSTQASPLIASLVQQGVAEFDALKIGFAMTPDGALLTKEVPSIQFFTLGSPARGVLWETSAVPEIRQQCDRLVHHLLNKESSWNTVSMCK